MKHRKTKPKISACLTVHNEEDLIKDCLKSIKGAVDEIVVVHDGPCADKTVKIARRYADKVLVSKAKSKGSSEFVRHLSYEQSTGHWVIVVDADERLSPGLRKGIRKLAQSRKYDAYWIRWPFYDEHGKPFETGSVKYKKVLFRKDRMYQIGLPHILGETRGTFGRSDLILEHHFIDTAGRKGKIRSDFRKNKRRAKMAAKVLAGPLDKIPTFNCSLEEKTLEQRRKLLFQRNWPLLALFIVPIYSFLYWYFFRGYWKTGWLGFQNSLNLPLYHLCLAWYLMCR